MHSQVSRNVFDIDEHRVLSHAQIISIHQVPNEGVIESLDEWVELINDDL